MSKKKLEDFRSSVAEEDNKVFSVSDSGTGNKISVDACNRKCWKIKIDGGVICSKNQKKCDWCIHDYINPESLFIELKGRHWEDGMQQIEETIHWFEQHIANFRCSNSCYVVMKSGKAPRFDTKSQRNIIKLQDGRKTLLRIIRPGTTVKFEANS